MRNLRHLSGCLLVLFALASCASDTVDTKSYLRAMSSLATTVPSNQTVLDACQATVFIYTQLTITNIDGMTNTYGSFGSGFIADGSTHVVTAKHVLYPEKFDDAIAILIGQGWTITNRRIHVWLPNQRFRVGEDNYIFTTGYSSDKDFTLDKVGTAHFITKREIISVNGLAKIISYKDHVLGSGDLASLKFKTPIPVKGLKVRNVSDTEKGTISYMLGYPNGPDGMGSDIVIPEVSPGFIRKVSAMLRTGSIVISGNSGGPVIDQYGVVIGVVSYKQNDVLAFSVPGVFIKMLLP